MPEPDNANEGRKDDDQKRAEIVKSEKSDEEQIVAEMRGGVIEEYFYESQQFDAKLKKNVTKVGISFAGIKWVAGKMAQQNDPISIEDVKDISTPGAYAFLVTAKRLSTGEKRYGTSEQSKTYRRYKWDKGVRTDEFTEETDEFALPKALGKAQRNAMRMFIPEVAIQKGYEEWKVNRAKTAKDVTPAPPGKLA